MKPSLVFLLLAVSLVGVASTEGWARGEDPPEPVSCAEGLKRFPALTPWVEKLQLTELPLELGQSGSFVMGQGVALAGKKAREAWEKQPAILELPWKRRIGRLRSRVVDDGNLGPVWSALLSDNERDLLTRCTSGGCKVKLNDHELASLEGLTPEARFLKFKELVLARVKAFQSLGQLFSYENTQSKPLNLEVVSSVSASAPGILLPMIVASGFVRPKAGSPGQLGLEILDAEPGHHKPVVALFQRSCLPPRASGEVQCQELVIYNNHYFDFWGRRLVFYPWCDRTLVAVHEMADVDELKGGGISKLLAASEISKLLTTTLETRLRYLRMLGF